MDHIPPRLHREFFDRIMQAEAIFSEAGIPQEQFRSILDNAILQYCYETRQAFSHYLRAELERHPAVYGRLSQDAVDRLLAE